MNKRWLKATLLILFALPIAWLTNRELRDSQNRRRAGEVVRDLGGKTGSLPNPIPFLGDELRYEFHGTQFTSDDISRLSVLQTLSGKHWVGIMFKDTNLSHSDIVRIRELLPDCHPFRVVDGERLLDRPADNRVRTSDRPCPQDRATGSQLPVRGSGAGPAQSIALSRRQPPEASR